MKVKNNNLGGARSEKLSDKTYFSSFSSMSNCMKMLDSPFGGIISSSRVQNIYNDMQEEEKKQEGNQVTDNPQESDDS